MFSASRAINRALLNWFRSYYPESSRMTCLFLEIIRRDIFDNH